MFCSTYFHCAAFRRWIRKLYCRRCEFVVFLLSPFLPSCSYQWAMTPNRGSPLVKAWVEVLARLEECFVEVAIG